MRFKNFDLNLLVVFDAIYREGNLTRASEALSITQPAVSNALMRLRQSLGDDLFVRDGKAMAPTPVALNMIDQVQDILRRLDDVIANPETFDPAISTRTFKISLSDVRAALLLPKVSAILAEKAPHAQLHCYRVERESIEADLASGRLDLAIDVPQFFSSSLMKADLPPEEFVCILRRGHPLAEKNLSLDAYLSLQHITVSGRRRGKSYVEAALKAQGKRLKSPLRLPTYPPAFQVLKESDYALSAPRLLAAQQDVVIKPLPFDLAPIRPGIFWHRTAEKDAASSWLRDLIIKAAQD
ncbi:LysR family transcriptional regulator [Rhodovibrionaceae bacterium A322]